MRATFADTHYFISLLNPHDASHVKATDFAANFSGRMVTTAWVIAEVANFMNKGLNRRAFVDFLADLESDPEVVVEPPTNKLYRLGLSLFAKRHDKEWSLTDCISFVVMESRKISEALSGDHHFEQAGFKILLK